MCDPLIEKARAPAASGGVLCLTAAARTEDGEVMAVQHREYPIFGVQFHPESILTPDGKAMLEHFIHL